MSPTAGGEGLSPGAYRRLLEVGAPLAQRPELGAVDLERYELGAELGHGGTSIVYEAWDRELGRSVALKVLARLPGASEAARERFLREARAAARLVHPNIAAVYDATPEAIAMQRVTGRTLGEARHDDPRELVALVRDAALALHFAHGEGVVHRDLKPANLMVEDGPRPHVYVMDFGLAKERTVEASLSASGTLVGTPAYMAPEQAAGRGADVGVATDVYGLGATLYACLAGRPPFEDDDLYRLLRRVVEEEPAPLRALARGVDADLALVVATCLRKEPERRYASALALASDLERWLHGDPIEARPSSLAYRLRRYVGRRQGAITASLVAVAAALLVAAPFVIRQRERRRSAEASRVLAERVFVLSRRVDDALDEARAARAAGGGRERQTYPILEAALVQCRAFLEVAEVGPAWFFVGELLREQGRNDEALAAFDRAADLRPDLEGLSLERGLTYAALFRDHVPVLGETPPAELERWRAGAEADLARATAERPLAESAERLFAEGQLAWVRGDEARAIERLREVVEMDGAFQDAHLSLARLYLATGRDDLAMRHSVIASDLLSGNRWTGKAVATGDGTPLRPERELLPLEGLRELFVDFHLLLALDPSDAHAYGLRGQVSARQALRAAARGEREQAIAHLELAVRGFAATLELEPQHAAALVDRGACRVQLARLLSASGESGGAGSLRAAGADYDAALRLDPTLAVARYDRALWHLTRARLAQLARSADEARAELERAREDALGALHLCAEDHPWRWRFQALQDELADPPEGSAAGPRPGPR